MKVFFECLAGHPVNDVRGKGCGLKFGLEVKQGKSAAPRCPRCGADYVKEVKNEDKVADTRPG